MKAKDPYEEALLLHAAWTQVWVKGKIAVVPSCLLDTSDYIKVPKSTWPQTHPQSVAWLS